MAWRLGYNVRAAGVSDLQGQGQRYSIVGERAPIFWAGAAAITLGVLLHLPMLAMAHRMGNRVAGMAMDPWMVLGMALIGLGVPLTVFGALPRQTTGRAPCGERGCQ